MDRRDLLIMAGSAYAVNDLPRPVDGVTGMLQLPSPKVEGGMSLMVALKNRHSERAFATKQLPRQVLSNLMWAAFGLNRPFIGGRTAPSAHGWQETELFVAMADGLFRYDYRVHGLRMVRAVDLRRQTGLENYAGIAPADLIYVADFGRMEGASPDEKVLYSAADTGFIAQNVYLCCAQEGLATSVRGTIDRVALAKEMELKSDQRIILAQTVGYPVI
jgi:nitroreductase